MDDLVFLGKSECQLWNNVKELQDLVLNIEEQWHPAEYIDVKVCMQYNDYCYFTQHVLIDSTATTKTIAAAVQKSHYGLKSKDGQF